MLAPVIVFVYNRVDKAKTVLQSLCDNELADKSCLYIFADGPKKPDDEKVRAVREYLDEFEKNSVFKETTIIKAKKNKGLAESVIDGVSQVIVRFGKVIVVEDDNICAKDFLDFMNGALDYYERDPKVWSVSGYTHITPENYSHDIYAMGRINSYAWGTWKRSWESVDWEVKDYGKNFRFNPIIRRQFNRFGNDSATMLDAQMTGNINSWAIRFSYAMFRRRMVTIYPTISRTKNIGEDGSGTHIVKSKASIQLMEKSRPVIFEPVGVEERIVKQFGRAVHRSVLSRMKGFLLYAVIRRGNKI